MYYRILVRKGHFNWANPSEVSTSNWVGVYSDEGKFIRAVSVTADGPIFYDGDEPEDIAEALENWLKGMLYASDEEEIRNMIQFLRKHSRALLKGKLHRDIKRIEEKIKELNEKKERLRKQYEELLTDDREGD